MRGRGMEDGKPRVAERCDICMEERLSVREGDDYICEICLDGSRPASREPVVKV